jgi:hypothetical protein
MCAERNNHPMTDTQAELLPCPCCRGGAVAVGGDIPTAKQITIKCDGPQKSGLRGCGIQIMGKRLRLSHAELLAALTERWNTRAPSPPSEMVERIARHLCDKEYCGTEVGWADLEDSDRAEYRDDAKQILQAAGVSGVPEGWPTREMEIAGHDVIDRAKNSLAGWDDLSAAEVFLAMWGKRHV